MQILAKCPKCGQILQLSLEAADRRITCPKCYSLFKVPDLEHLEKALEVIKDAGGTVFVDQDGNVYG
jgi:DNA-directed RNA polymerase subunit RPC12/RpoP